ncbi:MAG: VWA domain-containing protein [Clostridia bacterium]|nr:VWA domain-containing protein [Clostridia bacterium]
MKSVSLSFQEPWFLLALIPALAVVLIPYFLLPKKRRVMTRHLVPVILRSLAVTLLVLVLSGMAVVHTASDKAVMLLVDLSNSTTSVQEEMEKRSSQILSHLDHKTPAGVIVFGYDQVYTAKLEEGRKSFTLDEIDSPIGTDMENAITLANTVMPKDLAKQVILLSDGIETDGNALELVQYLSTQGVRVDCMHFDSTGSATAEMQISAFTAPEGAYVGDEILLTAQLQSNTGGKAVVELYENDKLLRTQNATVVPGSKTVEFPLTLEEEGTFQYRLLLKPEADTLSYNNQGYAALTVTGKPSVLILVNKVENGVHLEDLLRYDFNVTLLETKYAPTTIAGLCDYDQIILSGVDMRALPDRYDKLLKDYVGVFGRSLLVAGGENTMMYGNMSGTELEEMLPLSFQYQKSTEGKSVALMLVLDCSRSMSNNTNYISIAKQGAIKCVEYMTDNDMIGLISFHSQATVRSPMIQANARNKAEVTRLISELTTDQRTAYKEPLILAKQELEKCDADIKHVIFLSDGQPKDDGYFEVAREIASAGITLSSIGLDFDSDILEHLSGIGGGRYYYVDNAANLPNIMLSETKQMSVSNLVERDVTPVVTRQGEVTKGLEGAIFPPIHGFLGTSPKDVATVYVETDEGDPIYALRSWGEGTVGCFTTDLYRNWSFHWMIDPAAKQFVKQMISATVAPVHHESSFFADLSVGGQRTELVVTTYAEAASHSVTLNLSLDGEEKTEVLEQVEPGVYRTSFDTSKPGVYRLFLIESQGKAIVDYLDTQLAVSYSKEYDVFDAGGAAFLEKLADAGGGILSEDPKAIANAEASPIDLVEDPLIWLCLAAILLFLIDVGFRRLRKKDLLRLWEALSLPFRKKIQ